MCIRDSYQSKSTVVSQKLNNVDVFSIISDSENAYINYLQIAFGRVIRFQNLEIKKALDEDDIDILSLVIVSIRERFNSKSKLIIAPYNLSKQLNLKFIVPKAGDNKKLLDLSLRNCKIFRIERLKQLQIIDPERHKNRIMNQMKLDLKLNGEPDHIECFDVSNIQGTNSVAACVVFIDGKPMKKMYRKFIIKTIEGPNDFGSMEEVIYRRYSRMIREKTPLPKLIIIDGGKGQLSSAVKSLKKLKLIVTSGMRNKSINLEAAKKNKVVVTGTEINSNPTPELTWALILGLARNFKTEIDNMYQGYWQSTIGVELKGKILGLLGLGRVGSQVAKIGKAFGMQIMAWSENLNLDKCKELDVLPCNKDDLIQNSDFLSIHVQGGDRYRNCITIKEFEKMKKTSYLINTSRGEIVNEDDLIIALSTNIIAGAGIDVYEKEPLPESHKLRFVQNALLLPHIGYVTAENYETFYTQMIENLDSFISGKPKRVIE